MQLMKPHSGHRHLRRLGRGIERKRQLGFFRLIQQHRNPLGAHAVDLDHLASASQAGNQAYVTPVNT
ncbi:MAG TPA: hypothetical protein VJ738_12920 [Steroidobacteraceae bacterium]|nr:hypothetical protein [Steroidobacteraceae bacterium]